MSSRQSSRDRIVAVAHELLRERGAAVTVADVAEAAGVTRQAVYMHFSSRAGLMLAVVRWMDDRSGIADRCAVALGHADPVEALRRFLAAWLSYVPSIQPVASALANARVGDEDAARAWEDRMVELRAGHRRAARRLADAGLLRDGLGVDAAADLTWAMTSVAVWEQLAVDRGWSEQRIARNLIDAVARAVISEQRRPRSGRSAR